MDEYLQKQTPVQITCQQSQYYEQTFIPPYNCPVTQEESNGFQSRHYLLQDGANCGAFASALAVMSLAKFSGASGKEERKEEGSELGHEIAQDIQEKAKEQGLSSIGEFFSAENLVQALNTTPTFQANGLLAKSGTFETQEQLTAILKIAQERGVKVLISYFAGNSCEPSSPDGDIQPSEMLNAHWSLVNGVQDSKISLSEGNQIAQEYPIGDLFSSNQKLAGQFDWSQYLATLNGDERIQTISQLEARIHNDAIVHTDGAHYTEAASLRGKVVLIGVDKTKAIK